MINYLSLGFFVNALLAYPVYRGLIALKSRQTIDPYAPEGHQIKQGTPTMGGLMILPGLLIVAAGFGPNLAAVALILSFALIGFIDDYVVPRKFAGKRGLGWRQKLVMQVALAAGSLLLDPTFAGNWILLAFGTFLILFFANAYNFADGLDGLAGGLLLVYGFSLVSFLQISGMELASIAVAASTFVIPFLFLNAPPAKVFMGDVGSLPIGALLGLLNLYAFLHFQGMQDSQRLWTASAGLVVLNLILIAELVPVPIQVAFYKKTGKRIFPATPIHHAFEKKGIPETKIVWWFILFQLLLGQLASELAMEAQFGRGSAQAVNVSREI